MISIVLSMPSITRVFAQDDATLDGMVTENGCNTIGGNVRRLTTHNSTITVCEYHDKIFEIESMEGGVCPAVVGWWIDPETGEYFEFGYACNEPRLYVDSYCSVPISINNDPSDSYRGLFREDLEINGTKYDVFVNTKSIACYSVNLRQDAKELFVLMATNSRDSNRSMNITFSQELLQGEYKVLIDGNSTTFSMTKNGSNVTLSDIAFPAFADRESMIDFYKVQVIGTNVIPEFPSIVVVFAASAAMVAISTFLRRNRFF